MLFRICILLIYLLQQVCFSALAIHDNLIEKLKDFHIDPTILITEFSRPVVLNSQKMNILYDQDLIKSSGSTKLITTYGDVMSDSLIYNSNSNELELLNDVIFNSKDMNLYSNKAYVKVNSEIFIAKGNVKYKQNDYLGSADKAIFNKKKRNVLFEGAVVIKQGADYIKGDKVILDLKTFEFKTIGRAKIKVNKDTCYERIPEKVNQ